MKRRIFLVAVAALILALIGTGIAALHTQVGLRLSLAMVQTHSAGALQIGTAEGTLAGPITLHDVRIKSARFTLHIQRLVLDWRPLALFANRLDITSLAAQDVELSVAPGGNNPSLRFVKPVPPHLPVMVVISKLTVDDMRVIAPQLAQPLQIAKLSSTARFDNRSWRLISLSIEGRQLHAQAHANWEFWHGDRLQAALDWQLALPQQTPVNGQVSIQGNAQQLGFNLALSKPVQLQLRAKLTNLFSALAWQGQLEIQPVHTRTFDPQLPDIEVHGAANFIGNPAGTDFKGNLTAREPATGIWNGAFALRYQGAQLAVRQLELNRSMTHTHFQLAGNIDLSGAAVAPDLQGEWRALALPLSGKPWLESPSGKLRVQSKAGHIFLDLDGVLAKGGSFSAHGTVDMAAAEHSWQLRASAKKFHLTPGTVPRALPGFDWQLLAQGDDRQTLIKNLLVEGFGGSLQLQGIYLRNADHDWHARLRAQHLNPGLLFPEYHGDIGFLAQFRGQQSAAPHFSLWLESLSGSLRSAAVTGSGSARYAGGKWLFNNVTAQIADNRIRFDGHLGHKTNLNWNIEAPDLQALWPGLSGALDSQGSVELAGDRPATRFNIHATRLHYQDYSVAGLDAEVTMSNTEQGGDATLKANELVLNGAPVTLITAHASGTLLAHSVHFSLVSPFGKALIAGAGKLENDVWQGNLTTVTLEPDGAGSWQATAAWRPRIGADGIALPQACLVQGMAQTCGQAGWKQQTWQADATLNAVPLTDLQAVLPPGLEYIGSFGGTLQAGGDARQHRIDVTATLSPGSIHNVIRHQRVTLLDYTHGDAHIHIDSTLTTGSLNWTLRDGGFLNVNTRIAHGNTPALSGRIRGELHDFDLIPALIPDVSGFEGKLRIDLALAGTASDPTFNGTASLTDGAIRVPRLGLNVTGVLLDLQGNGDHLALSGTAQSGTGSLNWNSTASKQGGIWHAQGHLAGKDFRTADIPEAQVDISPTLDFTLDNRDITLDGDVAIPYAKLQPRNLSNTAQVSPDQVIVGQNEAAQQDRWRIHAKVNASMGDKVELKGFGLSGRITGSVQLVDEPGHFTTGSGELQIVDGQYAAYGQKLSIERGRLMFNGGPVSNPALDIRALRKPAHPETVVPGQSEQQVGVVVRGTLQDPSVSLFSSPPLPQTSLLSYLLTGQLPSTPSQSPLIGQPSTDTGEALTYSGGEFLAQQVGNQLGISDVSIQNVSTGIGTSTPSLFIGKYLSPRLYVSYGTGILQSINTIRIRYTLSTRWMLEAESGAANSADLIYTLQH